LTRHSLLRASYVVLVVVLGCTAFVWWGLPARNEVRALAKHNPAVTGVMRQRDEEAQARGRKARRVQNWVPLTHVSRHLIHAVVVAEDPNFFGHEGVDWGAVKESLETDLKRRAFARGGSTITQQVAKNVFFSTRKSVTRKLREYVVAGWLEKDLSKARILEIYLNVIEWGDGVFGCEAGAQRTYGKSAADLNEAEAAGLAAMIPSPRRINPKFDPGRHARAQQRILWLMARAGYVKRDVGGLGAEPPEERGDEGDAEPGPGEAVEPGSNPPQ
jgi:monofunctional biosynthetic peptidoglycan transglycosylase